MFKITQHHLDTSAVIRSLVINTNGVINPRYRPIIEDFDKLKLPTTKLDPLVTSPTAKTWKVPEIVTGPHNEFTMESHGSIFKKAPTWNYLTLARDIAELNNLDRWPSLKEIKACLKANKLTAGTSLSPTPVATVGTNYVKDSPIEYVLDVLFGNPNIQWKEAAALVKGIDKTVTSRIYQGYATQGLEAPVCVDFVKSPLMLMPDGKHYDRFRLFNTLMQARNEPIDKVPSEFTLKDFLEAPLEWPYSKSPISIYKTNFDKFIRITGGGQEWRGSVGKDVLCLFDQLCEPHLNIPKQTVYQVSLEYKAEYDTPDAKIIERLRNAPVSATFMINGKKDPLAFYIYTLKTYNKRWNWKSLLGIKS